MKFQVTQYAICVPLTATQWEKLDRRHDRNYKNTHAKLEAAGAESVDFNGHFGRNLFFKVETLEEVPAVLEAFKDLLKTPLREIPEYLH